MDGTVPSGEWQFTGRDELESVLQTYGLDPSDVCLVGSISLSARGLREHNDIDFVVDPAKRDAVPAEYSGEFVGVTRDRYVYIDLSDGELVRDDRYHDVIDGFKVVRPEITFSYKKLRDLQKDRDDITLLEEYSQATDDWDWDLYRSDYSQRPNTLLSRGIQSLRTDGVLVTADKVLGLLHRRFPVLRAANERVPFHDLRTPADALLGTERVVDRAELLNRQFVGDSFASMDLVAAWCAIEDIGRDDAVRTALDALGTDRETLLGPDGTDRKAVLAASRSETDPIAVTLGHRVVDTTAFARALSGGRMAQADGEATDGGETGTRQTTDITIRPTFARRPVRDTGWLEAQGLDATAVSHLEDSLGELLERVGGLFYAILWPPAREYFDEMERALERKVTIYESEDVTVDDITAFVHDIYDAQAHDAPAWAIDWKADLMTDFPPQIRVLKIILPTPRFNDGISSEMEMVKNDIRHEFVEHLSEEYYLSLLHATDNFADNRRARDVIESHR